MEYIYLLEKHRDNGIGTTATRMALSRWREMGYESISLDEVQWDNPQDFWGRLGFKGEGKRKSLTISDALDA